MKGVNMKLTKIFALSAVILTLSAVPAFAGEWKQDDKGWWYQDDDGTYPRNTWRWIDGNHDGTAECYYFNDMGYILTSCPAPGGGSLNELGQWYKNKTVQTRTVKVFKEGEIGGDYINSQNKIELRWADKDADYALDAKFIKVKNNEKAPETSYKFKDIGENKYKYTNDDGKYILIDYNNKDQITITSDIEKTHNRFADTYRKVEEVLRNAETTENNKETANNTEKSK